MAVTPTSYVKVHYKGTLDDGTVFDSSYERNAPIEVILGQKMLIPGFEQGLVDMKEGDKKTVKIPSEQAYGPKRDEMLQKIEKSKLPEGAEAGMQLVAQGPYGALPVTIVEITENEATLDFNHPLAGKNLTFDLEVVVTREPTPEDVKNLASQHEHEHDHDGCCGGHCDNPECKDGECADCNCEDGDCDDEDEDPDHAGVHDHKQL
jgi:peptidylprolyl isomerase